MGPGIVWASLDLRHSAIWAAQELQIWTSEVKDLPFLEIQGSGLLTEGSELRALCPSWEALRLGTEAV